MAFSQRRYATQYGANNQQQQVIGGEPDTFEIAIVRQQYLINNLASEVLHHNPQDKGYERKAVLNFEFSLSAFEAMLIRRLTEEYYTKIELLRQYLNPEMLYQSDAARLYYAKLLMLWYKELNKHTGALPTRSVSLVAGGTPPEDLGEKVKFDQVEEVGAESKS